MKDRLDQINQLNVPTLLILNKMDLSNQKSVMWGVQNFKKNIFNNLVVVFMYKVNLSGPLDNFLSYFLMFDPPY